MRTLNHNINPDFTCKNCGQIVSAQSLISGVVHRNHCPYCLHSRHVDLFEAGDRLCACKNLMAPVGLTTKKSRDKYTRYRSGELMLVHRCKGCGGLAINRIAADDDPYKILHILQEHSMRNNLAEDCHQQGINLLTQEDISLVNQRLFGQKNLTKEVLQYQSCPL